MCAAKFDPPESIGKYRIECVLGQGSMGVVYKAYDPQIDRSVAIKVLLGHLLGGENGQDFVQRFHQEAKAAARCLHPNIVTVFDFGTAEGLPFIVMEYVEGVDLRSKIQCDAPFSLNITLHICRQVLEAMAYAHSRGVIHRDIKPSNILLREDGSLKVSDFGVARIETSALTHAGYLMGTPNYMAPEALMGHPADKHWDLYSVGVLMFELLTKQIPQKVISQEEALRPLERSPSLSPQQLRSVRTVLQHALHPDPLMRVANAESFLRELKQIPLENPNPKEVESLVTKADITLAAQYQTLTKPKRPISSSGRWSTEVLKTLEITLTHYIGPMARFMVEKCSRETSRLDELFSSLAQHIPSERERLEFLNTLDNLGIYSLWSSRMHSLSPPPASPPRDAPAPMQEASTAITPEALNSLAHALAYYIGPLATRLVNKAAMQCRSLEELQTKVAQYIPSVKEREDFFKKRAKTEKKS